jgi:hypothetical protein
MATRILSFLQLCIEADPDFRALSNRPVAYRFSSGRTFYQPMPVYGSPAIMSDAGGPITDDAGTVIQSDQTTTPTGFPFGSGKFGTDHF